MIPSIPGIRYDVKCPRFWAPSSKSSSTQKVEFAERVHLDCRQKAISVQTSHHENGPGMLPTWTRLKKRRSIVPKFDFQSRELQQFAFSKSHSKICQKLYLNLEIKPLVDFKF
jgi:hypothetical protein